MFLIFDLSRHSFASGFRITRLGQAITEQQMRSLLLLLFSKTAHNSAPVSKHVYEHPAEIGRGGFDHPLLQAIKAKL